MTPRSHGGAAVGSSPALESPVAWTYKPSPEQLADLSKRLSSARLPPDDLPKRASADRDPNGAWVGGIPRHEVSSTSCKHFCDFTRIKLCGLFTLMTFSALHLTPCCAFFFFFLSFRTCVRARLCSCVARISTHMTTHCWCQRQCARSID
jgi:hypothetical protein